MGNDAVAAPSTSSEVTVAGDAPPSSGGSPPPRRWRTDDMVVRAVLGREGRRPLTAQPKCGRPTTLRAPPANAPRLRARGARPQTTGLPTKRRAHEKSDDDELEHHSQTTAGRSSVKEKKSGKSCVKEKQTKGRKGLLSMVLWRSRTKTGDWISCVFPRFERHSMSPKRRVS